MVCAPATRLPDRFVERIGALGVKCGTIDPRTIRLVTHKDVDDDGVKHTIDAFDELRRQ
jgi:hypothetical protein